MSKKVNVIVMENKSFDGRSSLVYVEKNRGHWDLFFFDYGFQVGYQNGVFGGCDEDNISTEALEKLVNVVNENPSGHGSFIRSINAFETIKIKEYYASKQLQENHQDGQLQEQGNFSNAPETEERKEIREGDILESKYSYGGETQLFDFYKVLKVTATMVTLQMLKKKRTYFPDADGHIYYDTPCVVEPTDEPEDVPTIRRKIKTYRSGKQYVKPQDYYTATIWEGKPKETYNLH